MFQLSQALAQKVCSSSTLAYYNPAAKSVLRTRQNISLFFGIWPSFANRLYFRTVSRLQALKFTPDRRK